MRVHAWSKTVRREKRVRVRVFRTDVFFVSNAHRPPLALPTSLLLRYAIQIVWGVFVVSKTIFKLQLLCYRSYCLATRPLVVRLQTPIAKMLRTRNASEVVGEGPVVLIRSSRQLGKNSPLRAARPRQNVD